MEVKNLCQEGNTLQATFGYSHVIFNESQSRFYTKLSPKYIISGAAEFQVKVNVTRIQNGQTVQTLERPLLFARPLVKETTQTPSFGNSEPPKQQTGQTLETTFFGRPLIKETTQTPSFGNSETPKQQNGQTLETPVFFGRPSIKETTQTPSFGSSETPKQFSFGDSLIENQLIFIKFTKLLQEDDLNFTIKLTSNQLGIVNKNFISDDGTWHVIYDSRNIKSSFDVTVHMNSVTSACPFAMLHEDTELTDFELRGEDGSVRMHRAVLAAASPVLRQMLSGTWREATEGRVDVPGTSKVTLQNLKDYVYLHTLPDNGLEPLLLLASCYVMKDLEQNCIYKIVSTISAENACGLLEFATKHKVPLLLLAILECAKNERFKLDELRKHLLGSKLK